MKVLVIAAHPDDEILGVGGTINKHTRLGDEVYIFIVTDGSSSQYIGNKQIENKKNVELYEANKVLGVKKVIHSKFPDMKLDTIPHIELNKGIEEIIKDIEPEVIYTHHYGDINKDHQKVFESTMVAARVTNIKIKEIYCYEVLSSTEWGIGNVANRFIPNAYVELEKQDIDKKIKALSVYETELREAPHPRSIESALTLSRYRGSNILSNYAEAFQLIRKITR